MIDVKEENEMTVFNLATSEKLINQKVLGIPIDWYSYVAVVTFFINRMISTVRVFHNVEG